MRTRFASARHARTALRAVLEALLGEESLLAAGEDEALAAVATGQASGLRTSRPSSRLRVAPIPIPLLARNAGGGNTGRVNPSRGARQLPQHGGAQGHRERTK